MLKLFIAGVPLQQENAASLCKAFILPCLTSVTFAAACQLGHGKLWKATMKMSLNCLLLYPLSEAREENVSSYVIFVFSRAY